MYIVNDDKSIYATRGDIVAFSVSAEDGDKAYVFQPGDVVRVKVFAKKDCTDVVLERDFPVYEATETVDILLTGEDTKIGEVISKPRDYWYEVELNPFSYPQTIIGYDEDGAKVFKLFPEGRDLEDYEYTEEDIPFMDRELDPKSTRPVENQAVARAVLQIHGKLKDTENKISEVDSVLTQTRREITAQKARIDNLAAGGYSNPESEIIDGRVSNTGYVHTNVGNHIRDVNDQLLNSLDNFEVEGYSREDAYKDIKRECAIKEGYFFRTPDSDMMESDIWNAYVLAVRVGERYHINTYSVSSGAAVAFMTTAWDAPDIDPSIEYHSSTNPDGEIMDVYVTVPIGAVQMIVNEKPSTQTAIIEKLVSKKFVKKEEEICDNYLKGKRLVCCGDSITEAVNPEGGYFKNYAEIVAERNGMTCYKDGVGGSTMAIGNGKSFSISRYLSLPAFDYLTIWFGWNDAAYSQLGTIADKGNATFYGAYKTVLEHLIINNPTAKIGLVVPYGSESVDPFAKAVREISALYGVPCLDLKDHNKCSLIWGTSNEVQLARRRSLTYDGTHPNQEGYNFLSTMYEHFLKSL